MLRTWQAGALGAALWATGCIQYLEPGELGQLRLLGDVRGEVPLRFSAPVSDRDGNMYVLFGSSDLPEAIAFVGHAGGDWSGGCEVHENAMRGAHGWVGRDRNRAWYWSGDSLVEVSGDHGGCKDVLDRDPASAADLAFKAVVPWVKETPSRSTTVALIQSPSDPVPFFVVIDLDLGIYTNLSEFKPRNALDVQVLGVGADPDSDSGFFVVKYTIDGVVRVEGRFVDDEADVTDIAPLEGLELFEEDAIVGYMQQNDNGWVAGVLNTGELLTFNRSGGRIKGSGNLLPVGVHRWEGDVFVVGLGNGRPAAGKLSGSGNVASSKVWSASERALRSLRGNIEILDDRIKPVKFTTWRSPRPAVGDFPFVQAHSPHPYARDTTLFLVAGDTFQTAGEPFTEVAVGPMGLNYP